jgi:predicted GNAT family acetyltransferase
MQLQRYDSVGAFLEAAGSYLAAREAEHNLMLGITSNLRRDAGTYEGPPLLVSVRAPDGEVLAAAIRTPPHNLILSEVTDEAAVARALVAGLAGEDLPGIVGPPGAARALADAWVAAHGGAWRVDREERIYRLSEVIDPEPGPGTARLAEADGADDAETVGGWLGAFQREALDEEAEAGMTERAIENWRIGNRRFWLWEVDGRPVSLVGAGGLTPHGIRIGPVYTPPAERGNGHASRLTAAVSRTVLAEGHRYCFLYTDLGNRMANHIYQQIGYRPVTDAVMLRLGAWAPASG